MLFGQKVEYRFSIHCSRGIPLGILPPQRGEENVEFALTADPPVDSGSIYRIYNRSKI